MEKAAIVPPEAPTTFWIFFKQSLSFNAFRAPAYAMTFTLPPAKAKLFITFSIP